MRNYNDQELRRHRRYRVKPGVFAVLGREFSKLGQIIDISMGGLAFSYAGSSAKPVDTTDLIFLFDKAEAAVQNLSYRFHTAIVSEKEIQSDTGRSGPRRGRIRCALQFKDLLYHQQKWLEAFLRNHTVEEPSRS